MKYLSLLFCLTLFSCSSNQVEVKQVLVPNKTVMKFVYESGKSVLVLQNDSENYGRNSKPPPIMKTPMDPRSRKIVEIYVGLTGLEIVYPDSVMLGLEPDGVIFQLREINRPESSK